MVNIRKARPIPPLDDKTMRRWVRQIWTGPETDCWIWIGSRTLTGYGQMRVGGHRTKFLAHRIGYVHRFGPIKNGAILMHECDNPSCVNPDHVKPGTVLKNAWDRINKGRHRGCIEVQNKCPL